MGASPHSVVITGASSGIGRSAAVAWGRRGAKLTLSGRNEVELARVVREVAAAGGQAIAVAGDVTREDDRRALVERATSAFGGVDVLVNNAGRGYYAAFRDIDANELEELFALNVVAPLRLTQLALPALEKSRGAVVMVSSIAGMVVAPRMAAYAASKFALEALAAGLRAETKASGVRVVVVRPGPVDTPFRDNSVTRGGEAGVRPTGAKAQSADAVGEMIVRAAERGTPVVETSMYVRAVCAVARFAPPVLRRATARMAAR
jgi:short-subunit dehydrogenase